MARPRRDRKPCPICGKSVTNLRSKYCSNYCQLEQQYLEYIDRWKSGLETGNISHGRDLRVSSHVRRYLISKYGENCTRCDWAEKNPVTGKVPVNVEHLDGNPHNSIETNLTFLCPNCHSLTPTFGSLNVGHGRKNGALAHLGERLPGRQEVAGSSPACSTMGWIA